MAIGVEEKFNDGTRYVKVAKFNDDTIVYLQSDNHLGFCELADNYQQGVMCKRKADHPKPSNIDSCSDMDADISNGRAVVAMYCV